MSDDTLKRAFEALDAIGALRHGPPRCRAYDFDYYIRSADIHWKKAMRAWWGIASYLDLLGAMSWAEENLPEYYHHVTTELPAEWERLWDEGAPLDEFQAALDRWVQAHEELIGLFPVTRGAK